MSRSKSIAGGMLAILFSVGLARASTISNVGSWDGSENIRPFGPPDTQVYGQTITAPSDNILDSFTFYFQLLPDPNMPANFSAPINFRAEVYGWDGSKATDALYESATTTVTDPAMQPITFNTGGVPLVSGETYVLFVTTLKDVNAAAAQSAMGRTASDTYAGGQFVFQNGDASINDVTGKPWISGFGGDLAFTASFSATPLPTAFLGGAVLLGAVGIAGLRGRLRRVAAVLRRF